MRKRFCDRRKSDGGFTLLEILIAVAIVAVLVAVAVPYGTGLLEKSREAADLANVRSAYSQVMMAAIGQDSSDPLYDSVRDRYCETVALGQRKDGWQTDADSLSIGGIRRSDSLHWKGDPRAGGSCVVAYDNKSGEVTLT